MNPIIRQIRSFSSRHHVQMPQVLTLTLLLQHQESLDGRSTELLNRQEQSAERTCYTSTQVFTAISSINFSKRFKCPTSGYYCAEY